MKIVIDTEKLQTTPYYAKNCAVTMEDIIKCGTPLQKGKWEYKMKPMYDPYCYKCSNCHTSHRARYNYCPSCGAEMESD